jgi:hypothetical protein
MYSETEQAAAPAPAADGQATASPRSDRSLDVNLVVQVASAVAGGAAFLYLLGGALLLVRFANAGVPAGRAVSLVEGSRLIEVGATGIAGPAILLIVTAVVVSGIIRAIPAPRPRQRRRRRPPRWARGVIIGVSVLLLIGLLPPSLAMAIVIVGLSGLTLWLWLHDQLDSRNLPALPVGLTFAAILALGSLAEEARGGPRLEPVTVHVAGSPEVRGGYIAQSAEAVYVARGHGIVGIPNERVREVRIGPEPSVPPPPDSVLTWAARRFLDVELRPRP